MDEPLRDYDAPLIPPKPVPTPDPLERIATALERIADALNSIIDATDYQGRPRTDGKGWLRSVVTQAD